MGATEPTKEQKEQKFLEQQYTALRTEIEQASDRAFKIFAASVLVVPTGLSLGAAAGNNVLPLIKLLLPLVLLAFYAMYWAQIFSTRRTGLYIESHIEPSLLHRTRGWESWLSDRRYAYDAQLNVAFFLLAAIYYLGTVYVAATARVKPSSPLHDLPHFLNFAHEYNAAVLPYRLAISDEWMLFILYALAGLAMLFLVQLLPSRQLKEEERVEEVCRSKPIPYTPAEIQDQFLENLVTLKGELKRTPRIRGIFKRAWSSFRGTPFAGLGRIKGYHCHTETSRQESKARHVRLTIRRNRKEQRDNRNSRRHTRDRITMAAGFPIFLGLLLWAVMPIQLLYKELGALRPTGLLPVSIVLVMALGVLLVALVVSYYHFVDKNIGNKLDIRIRPAQDLLVGPSKSDWSRYIVQTSLALEQATLDEIEEWLNTMLKVDLQNLENDERSTTLRKLTHL